MAGDWAVPGIFMIGAPLSSSPFPAISMALSFIIGTTSDSAVLFSFAGFEEVRDAVFFADFAAPLRRVRGFPDFSVCGSPVEFAKNISDWLAIVNLPYSILFGLDLPLVAHGVPLDEDDPFSDLSIATI